MSHVYQTICIWSVSLKYFWQCFLCISDGIYIWQYVVYLIAFNQYTWHYLHCISGGICSYMYIYKWHLVCISNGIYSDGYVYEYVYVFGLYF